MTVAPSKSAALLTTDPYARHVVARLLDFFADTSTWPRRLWEVSGVLALREAAEAGDWLRMRVLSPGAVFWYLRNLERQLGPDRPAIDLERNTLLTSASDIAARERMKAMLADPYAQLNEVRRICRGVFRRLYRQRNIVVHGGNTGAIALESALRTAAPLVGAGLDRLVHAELIKGLAPLDLAARAENSLALANDPLGPSVTSLLE